MEAVEGLPHAPPFAPLPLDQVRSLTDRFVGVIRTGTELASAAHTLQGASERAVAATERAPTMVAWLLAQAALRREESRGGHYRTDFPLASDRWLVRQAVSARGWARLPVSRSP